MDKELRWRRNRSLECTLIWASLGTSFYFLQPANKGIIYSTWIFCNCTQYSSLGTSCNDFLQTASPNYPNGKFLVRWLPRLALIKLEIFLLGLYMYRYKFQILWLPEHPQEIQPWDLIRHLSSIFTILNILILFINHNWKFESCVQFTFI